MIERLAGVVLSFIALAAVPSQAQDYPIA